MREREDIEEENLKLKYLLRAARAEIKKRENDLRPLNFKIGEMESYIDELQYEKNALKKDVEKTKNDIKSIVGNKQRETDSFYKKRINKALKARDVMSSINKKYMEVIKKRNNRIKQFKIMT